MKSYNPRLQTRKHFLDSQRPLTAYRNRPQTSASHLFVYLELK